MLKYAWRKGLWTSLITLSLLQSTHSTDQTPAEPSSELQERLVQLRLVGQFEGTTLNVHARRGSLAQLEKMVEDLAQRYNIEVEEQVKLQRLLMMEFVAVEEEEAVRGLTVAFQRSKSDGVKRDIVRSRNAVSQLVAALQASALREERLREHALALAESMALQRDSYRELLESHRQQISSLRRELHQLPSPPTPPPSQPVNRYEQPPSLEVYRRHARNGIPFIVSNLTSVRWTQSWTLDHILSVCGESAVTFKQKAPPEFQGWAGIRQSNQRGSLIKLVSSMAGGSNEESVAVHDESIPAFCPRLLEEFEPPWFLPHNLMECFSHIDQRNNHSSCHRNQNEHEVEAHRNITSGVLEHLGSYWPSLFVGSAGFSSGLHSDFLELGFWMVVLQGAKHWTIYDREDSALLFPRADRPHVFQSNTSSSSSSASSTAKLLAKRFEGDVRAGELIFIPSGCPHQVDNLHSLDQNTTIAVSANFVDSSSAPRVLRRLDQETNSGLTHMDRFRWREHSYPAQLKAHAAARAKFARLLSEEQGTKAG